MSDITRRLLLQAAVATVTQGMGRNIGAAESPSSRDDSDAQRRLYTHSPIEVYTNTLSAEAGEELTLHVSTTARRFNLQIARIGLNETVVWTREGFCGAFHPTPDDAGEKGCRWPVVARLIIPATWKSGYYQIKAITADEGVAGAEFVAFVVVRAEKPTAKMLLVLATATYGAYNDYGGASLYMRRGAGPNRSVSFIGASKVSFQRPWMPGFLHKPEGFDFDAAVRDARNIQDNMDDRLINKRTGLAHYSIGGGFHNWERVMVYWLEQHGYQVDYAVSSDLELHPQLLGRYRLMMSVGHDEYWSWGMRDTVESFIAAGGNVCFFSGNIAAWQVRYEDHGNRMVGYKEKYQDDPYFKSGEKHLTTTFWSSHHIGRPESQMTGLSMWYAGMARFVGATPQGAGGYLIYRPEHWVFKDTGLSYGDCLGQDSTLIHYEVDGCPIRMENGLPYPAAHYEGPSSLEILGMIPASLGSDDQAGITELVKETFGQANPQAVQYVSANRGHAVMSLYTHNGTVFCAGTTDWTSGLTGKDPAVERVTQNLIDRLSV